MTAQVILSMHHRECRVEAISQHRSLLVLQLQGQWNRAVQPVWCALVDSPTLSFHKSGCRERKMMAEQEQEQFPADLLHPSFGVATEPWKCSAPHRSHSVNAREGSEGASLNRRARSKVTLPSTAPFPDLLSLLESTPLLLY